MELFPEQPVVIHHEGRDIKPDKRGLYRCPFWCGDSRYPRPTFKTGKGLIKHIDACSRNPSVLKKQADDFSKRKSDALATVTHKVGDKIHYVREIIIKPTHETNRWGRLVHVRYEAVKRFEFGSAEINSIDWNGGVIFNSFVRLEDLCATEQEARDKAKSMQDGYDEHVRFSEMHR